VIKAGGLHVLGTERHEARRIDNQLRGRSGRQGDSGSSQFYVSMEDDLMRIFGGDRIKRIMEALQLPETQSVENRLISRSLESAQKRVESYNFDLRKHLVEYDDVMNRHRETIYKIRRKTLTHLNLKDEVLKMIFDNLEKICELHAIGLKENWNLKEISESLKAMLGANLPNDFENRLRKIETQEELIEYLKKLISNIYKEREKRIGPELMRLLEKTIYLRTIDTLWIEHLTLMEELRTGIGLRGIGQRDPLVEYKREAYNMFSKLLTSIEAEVANLVFKAEITKEAPAPVSPSPLKQISMSGGSEQAAAGTFSGVQKGPSALEKEAASRDSTAVKTAKIGRNDPCPCGKVDPNTGKPIKYKKCCGRFK